MQDFIQFIGRFHPLLVHLPIGILVLAVIFDVLSGKEKFRNLKPAVELSYLFGAIAAIFTCITGYLLSLSGEYEAEALSDHKWLGIWLAVFASSFYVYKKSEIQIDSRLANVLPVFFLLLLSLTGHMGGNLTHGSDYLLTYMPQPFKSWLGGEAAEEEVIITNVQEAVVYPEIIRPILQKRCYSCHGSNKQKGKLRLDSPAAFEKGGESGEIVIKAGSIEESELLRRIHLPKEEEEHMPPKEKNQLTHEEIKLIEWWVAQGASYDAKVADLEQPEEMAKHLLALEAGNEESKNSLANIDLDMPNGPAVKALQAKKVVVLPIGKDSPFLTVNFVNVDSFSLSTFKLLEPIAQNIVHLKVSDQDLTDEFAAVIAKMTHLQKLHLDDTKISDQGLRSLVQLEHLTYLNLVGTNVGDEGLLHLKELPRLERVFAYHTKVQQPVLNDRVTIDLGGYVVPTYPEDTTRIPE